MNHPRICVPVYSCLLALVTACSGGGGGGGAQPDGPSSILPDQPSGLGVAGDLDGIWQIASLLVAVDPPPTGNSSVEFFKLGSDLAFVSGVMTANSGSRVDSVERPREASVWTSTRDFYVNSSSAGVLSYALGETIQSDLFDLGKVRIGMVVGTRSASAAFGKLMMSISVQGWRGTDPDPSGTRAWDVQLLRTGVRPFGSEYGGTTGTPFADKATTERVTSIRIRAGSFIDAVQFNWESAGGRQHGGDGGEAVELTLDADEYVIVVSGETGSFVERLMIQTNKRSYGPYGGSGGTGPWQRKPFSLIAPSGTEICGLRGGAGEFLDRLGVLIRER